MIVAPEGFRDEECFAPKKVFEDSGANVVMASKGVEKAKGKLGGEVDVNIDLNKVILSEFDAIVFVGGPGSSVFFDDEQALSIAREAAKEGKIVAAICIAPSILANADVLNGKKATAFESEKDNLTEKGADYTGEAVTVDRKIITANGPAAAKAFGEAIIKALS